MPRRLAADTETLTERYGRFSAQPFERGFGTTVGNSLRRALLSSIEGAAITAVKIEGVEHEFSSIKGVVEDATDVILNLKQVPFKLHSSEPKTLRISKEEAGEVTAADIEADGDVEILDPTVHIGQHGLTPAVISSLEDALRTRELVKVKLGVKGDVKPKDVAASLALATSSDVVQVIGRTATLFRENPDLDKKRGDLPPWRR